MFLKKHSQKANPMTLKMSRLVAIEDLYRMSMMILQKNKLFLLSQMKKNPSKVDTKVVKIHKTKNVNLNGIPYRLRVICTLLCICSLSTYRIIQGLLTRKSEIWDIFVGELWANS
jgi:hypothetical protein